MVWEELAKTLDFDVLQSIITVIGLGDLPAYGENILKGQISGRVVVDLSL
jgi:hypothetical protein